MNQPTNLRCAIYTRKSSEEGLEQSFNSLHAQREACEAFIQSQQHEGWRLIKTTYDDGGFSGGSMDRPALRALLADIRSEQIDVVVVYKVDRLTRSLTDFARIVETFEAHKVSFVSVTQSFNTTSSMGRLTLNVLLSFAQFEREVTGERIRDKFAASRKKGMWMGGYPPLGYDVQERKLIVNEAEAAQVRMIFERYLALGSVDLLVKKFQDQGVRSKQWQTAKGNVRGGSILCRGALYTILRNRVYLGDAVHKGTAYTGEHAPLVDPELWHRVAEQLSAHRRKNDGNGRRGGNLLSGLLFDDRGHPMVPTHAKKGVKRYRYYVSQALIRGRGGEAGTLPRVTASAVEEIVLEALRKSLSGAERTAFDETDAPQRWRLVRRHLRRVTLEKDQVTLERMQDARPIEIRIQLKTWGGETLILAPREDGQPGRAHPDVSLIKALGRAWVWRKALERGDNLSVEAVAKTAGFTERYVARILRMAYLAPDIIEAILEGRQPYELTLARLREIDIPIDWAAQRNLLGFSANQPSRQYGKQP